MLKSSCFLLAGILALAGAAREIEANGETDQKVRADDRPVDSSQFHLALFFRT